MMVGNDEDEVDGNYDKDDAGDDKQLQFEWVLLVNNSTASASKRPFVVGWLVGYCYVAEVFGSQFVSRFRNCLE